MNITDTKAQIITRRSPLENWFVLKYQNNCCSFLVYLIGRQLDEHKQNKSKSNESTFGSQHLLCFQQILSFRFLLCPQQHLWKNLKENIHRNALIWTLSFIQRPSKSLKHNKRILWRRSWDWKVFQSDWLSLFSLRGRRLVQLAGDLKVSEIPISALAVEEILGLERHSVWLAIFLPCSAQRVVQFTGHLKVPETRISALAVEEILGLPSLSVWLAISLPCSAQRVVQFAGHLKVPGSTPGWSRLRSWKRVYE